MYKITVEAKDHGKPSLTSTAVITLKIVDTNTHPPTFKDNKASIITIIITIITNNAL